MAAAHHLLLGHGLGLDRIRERAPQATAGITLNLFPVTPADAGSPADVEAARRVDGLQNRVFLDPVLRGEYPPDVLEDLAPFGLGELIKNGDLAAIGAPVDVLGVNYYRAHLVTGTPSGEPAERPSEWVGAGDIGFVSRGLPLTGTGWEVDPDGLTGLLVRLHEEYPRLPPVQITENGAAFPDVVEPDGSVRDRDRVAFLESHLRAIHAAIQRGVNVCGYFYWSLLDNFEWAEGYAKRFGLVYVDFESQLRIPKASARRYAQAIAANGVPAS